MGCEVPQRDPEGHEGIGVEGHHVEVGVEMGAGEPRLLHKQAVAVQAHLDTTPKCLRLWL